MPAITPHNRPISAAQLKHDLRNPFGQILGFCEIVLEEAQDLSTTEDSDKVTEVCAITRRLLSAIDAQFSAAGRDAQTPVSEDFVRHLEAAIEPGIAEILNMKLDESVFASSEPQAQDIQQILTSAASVRAILESATARVQAAAATHVDVR